MKFVAVMEIEAENWEAARDEFNGMVPDKYIAHIIEAPNGLSERNRAKYVTDLITYFANLP